MPMDPIVPDAVETLAKESWSLPIGLTIENKRQQIDAGRQRGTTKP